MNIYLCSRYSRKEEMLEYRKQLQGIGCHVTSSWLDEDYPLNVTLEDVGEHDLRIIANQDIADIEACDLLISFNEPENSSYPRGGRLVEMGVALGLYRDVWCVGHKENVFCYSTGVEFYDKWDKCFTALREMISERQEVENADS